MKKDYIKLIDPNINYNIKEIDNILKSKWVTTGKWVKKLEEEVCKIHNVNYAVATSSGTMACMLLLKSLPIKVETIAMPAFTWDSIKHAVKWLGYKVKWVDINADNWMADFTGVKADLYMPTYTFGNFEFYNDDKFPMIFDAAHCLGNMFVSGEGYGSFFSLSPAKAFTGCEGGILITNNKEVYEKALELRRFMGRLEEINAYICLQNLKKARKIIENKNKIFKYYKEQLNEYGYFQEVNITNYNEIGFVCKDLTERSLLHIELKDKMDIRMRYASPELSISNSTYIFERIIMLPGNSMKEAKQVVKMIKEVLKIRPEMLIVNPDAYITLADITITDIREAIKK